MFYGNIIACIYNFYGRFKNEAPYSRAIGYVIFCQMTHFFLISALIKTYCNLDILAWIPNNFVLLFLFSIWCFFMLNYFPKKKVELFIEKFNQKTKIEKIIWGVISIGTLIVPFIFVYSLYTK